MLIDVYSYQRDPEYFPNPNDFDPSRWEQRNPSDPQLLTFGMGLRACFGKRLANTELKCFVFKLLQNYEIMPTGSIETEFNFGKFLGDYYNLFCFRTSVEGRKT